MNNADWLSLAKTLKMTMLDATDHGDISPAVLPCRDGEIMAAVMPLKIDKELALQAASMCRVGFDPDSITVILDAHFKMENAQPGQDIEDAMKEFQKKYPPGSMQKMCEEGACTTGEIVDCLICHTITRDGNVELLTVPYSYSGKSGPPLKWLDSDERYASTIAVKSGDEVRGYIPETLQKIMKVKPPEITEALKALSKGQSDERIRFHTARAMMRLIRESEFIVMDFLSPRHPEWLST